MAAKNTEISHATLRSESKLAACECHGLVVIHVHGIWHAGRGVSVPRNNTAGTTCGDTERNVRMKTTEKIHLNVSIDKKLRDQLQELANKNLTGNLSQLSQLIFQDFIDNKRQITIGGKKEENHAE